MKIQCGEIYHVFNRGNNKEPIFFNRENYLYFLRKVRKHLSPYCDILAYCLMPNHFHFLIYMNEKSTELKAQNYNNYNFSNFSAGIKTMLSSYTQAINNQEDRTGSLFSQNTKVVPTSGNTIMDDYSVWCFIYIHSNPIKARLTEGIEDWEFSSYRDYCGIRNGTLCNKELAAKELDFELNEFQEFINQTIPKDFII